MSASGQPLVGYFGFGSLVNKHTLRTSYVGVIPASLKGWRRHWQARTDTLEENVALLSIHKDRNCELMGVIVIDLAENLPLVDEREKGYARVSLNADDVTLQNRQNSDPQLPEELYVYVAHEAHDKPDDGLLLQSYLDAVMQGFFLNYGAQGVSHFVDTTRGFKRKMIADRDQPMYPRSVSLSQQESLLFESELRRAGVSPIIR